MIIRNPVIKSSLYVFLFWWVISTAIGLPGFVFTDDIVNNMFGNFSASLIGIVLSGLLVFVYIWLQKQSQLGLIAGETIRGLTCTIGQIPRQSGMPERSELLPDFTESRVEERYMKMFLSWREQYENTVYGNLMDAMLKTYNYAPYTPATHVKGGHGGRTVLEHGMLSSALMMEHGETWKYTGLKTDTKKVVLKLNDPDYIFNIEDPMIAVIGMAHDIGKLEAYFYDECGDVIGSRHEHDSTGCRMLARMPESWDLPEDDRQALFMSVAHYHHPMDLPLSPLRTAVDDRTIALMELLIKVDSIASVIETDSKKKKRTQAPLSPDNEPTPIDTFTTVTYERLWIEFMNLINGAGRLNTDNPKYGVGVKGSLDNEPALFLNERDITAWLAKNIGLAKVEEKPGQINSLTRELLLVLDSRGLLVRKWGELEVKPQNALFSVGLMKGNERVAGWNCLVIRLKGEMFDKLAELPEYSLKPVIEHFKYGGRGLIKNKSEASINDVMSELSFENQDAFFNSPQESKASKKTAHKKNITQKQTATKRSDEPFILEGDGLPLPPARNKQTRIEPVISSASVLDGIDIPDDLQTSTDLFELNESVSAKLRVLNAAQIKSELMLLCANNLISVNNHQVEYAKLAAASPQIDWYSEKIGSLLVNKRVQGVEMIKIDGEPWLRFDDSGMAHTIQTDKQSEILLVPDIGKVFVEFNRILQKGDISLVGNRVRYTDLCASSPKIDWRNEKIGQMFMNHSITGASLVNDGGELWIQLDSTLLES
jgi:hypothetical protein